MSQDGAQPRAEHLRSSWVDLVAAAGRPLEPPTGASPFRVRHHVMMTHAGDTLPLVRVAAAALKRLGVECFVDESDLPVTGIAHAVHSADLMVAWLSPLFPQSPWSCRKVLARVVQGRPHLPVFYDVEPSIVPMELRKVIGETLRSGVANPAETVRAMERLVLAVHYMMARVDLREERVRAAVKEAFLSVCEKNFSPLPDGALAAQLLVDRAGELLRGNVRDDARREAVDMIFVRPARALVFEELVLVSLKLSEFSQLVTDSLSDACDSAKGSSAIVVAADAEGTDMDELMAAAARGQPCVLVRTRLNDLHPALPPGIVVVDASHLHATPSAVPWFVAKTALPAAVELLPDNRRPPDGAVADALRDHMLEKLAREVRESGEAELPPDTACRLTVLGNAGGGKTTLLRVLRGEAPDAVQARTPFIDPRPFRLPGFPAVPWHAMDTPGDAEHAAFNACVVAPVNGVTVVVARMCWCVVDHGGTDPRNSAERAALCATEPGWAERQTVSRVRRWLLAADACGRREGTLRPAESKSRVVVVLTRSDDAAGHHPAGFVRHQRQAVARLTARLHESGALGNVSVTPDATFAVGHFGADGKAVPGADKLPSHLALLGTEALDEFGELPRPRSLEMARREVAEMRDDVKVLKTESLLELVFEALAARELSAVPEQQVAAPAVMEQSEEKERVEWEERPELSHGSHDDDGSTAHPLSVPPRSSPAVEASLRQRAAVLVELLESFGDVLFPAGSDFVALDTAWVSRLVSRVLEVPRDDLREYDVSEDGALADGDLRALLAGCAGDNLPPLDTALSVLEALSLVLPASSGPSADTRLAPTLCRLDGLPRAALLRALLCRGAVVNAGCAHVRVSLTPGSALPPGFFFSLLGSADVLRSAGSDAKWLRLSRSDAVLEAASGGGVRVLLTHDAGRPRFVDVLAVADADSDVAAAAAARSVAARVRSSAGTARWGRIEWRNDREMCSACARRWLASLSGEGGGDERRLPTAALHAAGEGDSALCGRRDGSCTMPSAVVAAAAAAVVHPQLVSPRPDLRSDWLDLVAAAGRPLKPPTDVSPFRVRHNVMMTHTSRDTKPLVRVAAAALKRLRVECFVDESDLPAVELAAGIAHAVHGADLMVAWLSPSFPQSPWSCKEVLARIVQGRPHVSAFYDVEPDAVPQAVRKIVGVALSSSEANPVETVRAMERLVLAVHKKIELARDDSREERVRAAVKEAFVSVCEDFGPHPDAQAAQLLVDRAGELLRDGAGTSCLRKWSEERVVEWLSSLGSAYAAKYSAAFTEHGIDGSCLAELTDDDLREDLGVSSALHRKKILRKRDDLL